MSYNHLLSKYSSSQLEYVVHQHEILLKRFEKNMKLAERVERTLHRLCEKPCARQVYDTQRWAINSRIFTFHHKNNTAPVCISQPMVPANHTSQWKK